MISGDRRRRIPTILDRSSLGLGPRRRGHPGLLPRAGRDARRAVGEGLAYTSRYAASHQCGHRRPIGFEFVASDSGVLREPSLATTEKGSVRLRALLTEEGTERFDFARVR